jgi:N-acetylneuraminic acid mutarotase
VAIGLTAQIVTATLAACDGSYQGASLVPTPGPGTWQAVRSLPTARFEGAAAVAGGRIYFLGGITDVCADGSNACESDRVDVYDATTDAWMAAPPLPAAAPRHHLALAAVQDRIYVLGGFVGILDGATNFGPVATTFVLDGTGWQQLADQPIARGAATAQAIGGTIFVAGGGRMEPDALGDLYAYDTTADRWTARSSMPTAREHLASCLVGGRMLAVGGWNGQKQTLGAAELYDPATNAWRTLAPLPTPRGGLGAAAIGDVCFAIGGEQWVGPLPGTFSQNEGFDVTLETWRSFAPMPTRRHGLGLAALGGYLYAGGGGPVRGDSTSSVVEQFLP